MEKDYIMETRIYLTLFIIARLTGIVNWHWSNVLWIIGYFLICSFINNLATLKSKGE